MSRIEDELRAIEDELRAAKRLKERVDLLVTRALVGTIVYGLLATIVVGTIVLWVVRSVLS